MRREVIHSSVETPSRPTVLWRKESQSIMCDGILMLNAHYVDTEKDRHEDSYSVLLDLQRKSLRGGGSSYRKLSNVVDGGRETKMPEVTLRQSNLPVPKDSSAHDSPRWKKLSKSSASHTKSLPHLKQSTASLIPKTEDKEEGEEEDLRIEKMAVVQDTKVAETAHKIRSSLAQREEITYGSASSTAPSFAIRESGNFQLGEYHEKQRQQRQEQEQKENQRQQEQERLPRVEEQLEERAEQTKKQNEIDDDSHQRSTEQITTTLLPVHMEQQQQQQQQEKVDPEALVNYQEQQHQPYVEQTAYQMTQLAYQERQDPEQTGAETQISYREQQQRYTEQVNPEAQISYQEQEQQPQHTEQLDPVAYQEQQQQQYAQDINPAAAYQSQEHGQYTQQQYQNSETYQTQEQQQYTQQQMDLQAQLQYLEQLRAYEEYYAQQQAQLTQQRYGAEQAPLEQHQQPVGGYQQDPAGQPPLTAEYNQQYQSEAHVQPPQGAHDVTNQQQYYAPTYTDATNQQHQQQLYTDDQEYLRTTAHPPPAQDQWAHTSPQDRGFFMQPDTFDIPPPPPAPSAGAVTSETRRSTGAITKGRAIGQKSVVSSESTSAGRVEKVRASDSTLSSYDDGSPIVTPGAFRSHLKPSQIADVNDSSSESDFGSSTKVDLAKDLGFDF